MDGRSTKSALLSNTRQEADASLSLSEELARCPVTAAAQRRIESAHHRRLRQVRCEHRDGVLVLTGQVPTFYYKQIAQECVRIVPGVTRIQNLLEVIPESNSP
jgi:osmotically-inducible protein OsmY